MDRHQINPDKSSDHNTLEKVFNKVLTPFEEFIHKETTSGFLLFACAVIAMVLANSALASVYQHTLHTMVSFGFGDWVLEKTLHHWINDGLMALFFFLIGLEIKREVLVGELSDPRQAALPIVAAIGGMVVPALIYYSLNMDGEGAGGWGITMATDIAFAIGAMVLLGNRIPKALLTFLVALAIVDDLGAVIVIALFYTEQIAFDALGIVGLLLVVLIIFNMAGIRKTTPYLFIGAFLWFAMLKSGVHATLAGVITALTIPATSKFKAPMFSQYMRDLLDKFDKNHDPEQNIMNNEQQGSILQTMGNGVHMLETPLQRLEHNLHLPVAFFIIPIFALANAGIPISLDGIGDTLSHPITLGVMSGLVLGKVIGIAGFCWIALKLGVGTLPANTQFSHIIGAGLLAGIGFTMSIFIAELAFPGQAEYLLLAKTGILFASLIAGIAGYVWLYLLSKK